MTRRILLLAGALLVASATAALVLLCTDLPRQTAYMAAIFVLAAGLWTSEAVPPFATALLVIGLEVLLLANPGQWPGLGFEGAPSPTYASLLAAAVDPVLLLFFGGFLLAHAAVKEGVDAAVGSLLLRRFGTRPPVVLLGVMLICATFSMWMSNTATAAMLIVLVAPMIARLAPADPFRKALALGVAFSANVGGMATPIGSPPNAVAIGFLRSAGHPVDFLTWMLLGTPLMLGLLGLTWLLLVLLFPAAAPRIEPFVAERPLTRRSAYVVVVFLLTVALWLSQPLHGLPASVVALLPIVALTAGGTLAADDVNRIEWSILLLIAGGVALGAGMQLTGLDRHLATLLMFGQTALTTTAVLSLVGVTLLLSTFISNTAAANLVLPIGISFAAATAPADPAAAGAGVLQVALSIALTASVAMVLPISTPPNAIAYARGDVSTRDMALAGGIVGLAAALLIALTAGPVLRFWGIGSD